MDNATREFVLQLLAEHNILTLATLREDGWPQATTVGYANDGLTIYVATFPASQKVHNIRHDNRVSLTIDRDYENWGEIKGLSMAARAEVLTDNEEINRIGELFSSKFPQIAQMPMPEAFEVAMLRLTPVVISVLNYEKGFGYTELVPV